jgi:hypothetical protein
MRVDLGRDVRRLIGREQKASIWADPATLELLPLLALKREAAAAGLAAHQAGKRDRAPHLLTYTAMLREIVRRTGDADTLSKAASVAARAAREAEGADHLAAAKLEQAAIARLGGELFFDPEAHAASDDFLKAAEAAATPAPGLLARRLALRAALDAGAALAAADLDQAVQAAGVLDAAVDRLEAEVRDTGQGKVEAAGLRCDRADFLIGFGARLKDKSLLTRAESDLTQLGAELDPNYLPLSWARAEGLRGAALAALGDLAGEPKSLVESVRVLAAAAEHTDFDHSPLDRARLSHGLALALTALAEAVDDEGLYDHALAAFDQALAVLEPARTLALRALAAHDRAACVARRAERAGDATALAQAESAFRAELAARDASADPVAWAVTQLALTRVYAARAELSGGALPGDATVALTEALDVFTERGLKSLAEAAQNALERLKGLTAKG